MINESSSLASSTLTLEEEESLIGTIGWVLIIIVVFSVIIFVGALMIYCKIRHRDRHHASQSLEHAPETSIFQPNFWNEPINFKSSNKKIGKALTFEFPTGSGSSSYRSPDAKSDINIKDVRKVGRESADDHNNLSHTGSSSMQDEETKSTSRTKTKSMTVTSSKTESTNQSKDTDTSTNSFTFPTFKNKSLSEKSAKVTI